MKLLKRDIYGIGRFLEIRAVVALTCKSEVAVKLEKENGEFLSTPGSPGPPPTHSTPLATEHPGLKDRLSGVGSIDKNNDSNQDGEDEVFFFWDPPSTKNRNSKSQNHVRQLQEQLAQATMKIRDLESEVKRIQKVNNSSLKDELTEEHQKAEFIRAKQDMMNRIIRMEEKVTQQVLLGKDETREGCISKRYKSEEARILFLITRTICFDLRSREAERNSKRMQSDEAALINDFRTVLSKLNSLEKLDLVRGALKALETENEKYSEANKQEKSDFDEKFKRPNTVDHEPVAFKTNFDVNSKNRVRHDGFIEASSNMESELYKKIEELQEENKTLFASVEELDQQHEESIEKLLSLKEEIEKKHECLQHAYEQLYVDYNQAQDKVAELEGKLAGPGKPVRTEAVSRSVQINGLGNVDKHVQTNEPESEEEETSEEQAARSDVDELTKKVKDILKGSFVEVETNESIFETLARQYIDVKWKKDVVEKWIDSLHEEVKRLQTENATLRKKNSLRKKNTILRGTGPNETPLDENDELRKKVELLESTVKETQEQLRMSLEKCKGLDENIEFIEELKLDLENARRELKTSTSNAKQLENNLTLLQDEKNGVHRENEELSRRNKELETEISQWRENNSETGNKDTLEDLREEVNKLNSDSDRLKRDLAYMSKDLNEAFDQIDSKESFIARLSQENKSLTKENSSLLEQLTNIQDKCNDKIAIVNREKNSLEEVWSNLKEKMMVREGELEDVRKRLERTEAMHETFTSEYRRTKEANMELQLENTNLKNEVMKYTESNSESTEKLLSMQNDYAQLENEVETLRLRERELQKLQESFAVVSEENKTLKGEYETVQDSCRKLEHDIECLQAEKKELLNRINENVCDNEKQEIIVLLEEKTRENNSLKDDNSRLMTEITNSQKKLQEVIESHTESSTMAKETIESLSHLIKEKDEEIGRLKNELDLAKNNTEISNHIATIQNERDELVKLVTIKHNESVQYHGEIQRLTHLFNEQTTQIQSLLAEKDVNLAELREKDAQLLWSKNELQAVQQRLRNAEELNPKETCGIVEHSTQIAQIGVLTEKCNALEAALIQEQSNNRMLQNQLKESQSKEASAGKELERLRTHLVDMEASYTEDALVSEEARKELEAKLQQAEEKVKINSNAYTSASIRTNQQVETLQQQMALIIQQRDDIQNKLSSAEDKILSQTASLTNLQIVLEQFQRDKEKDIIMATERIQSKLTESHKKQEELANDVIVLKEQLAEAKECLQAASRLSEQLDKKTERIEQLSQEVDRLTNLVNTADHRIEEAKLSGESKVDKTLIKNLLLGYLSSSAADKSSVLRVFSTVLEFSEAEKDKAGLNNAVAQNSWFSRLSGGSTIPNKDHEASLSAAFVRFLENESKPKPQLPALPIQTSPLSRPGHSRQQSTSSTQSTSLLSNVNLPTFPDFIPARNTGSILKEVLKDS
ncbi:Thyroid receptor-interacting protein 11 [Eufriesea mexicana]|uniref:Thyroid receptor-interacting protein 11 n=1 Tax=Eufriesea mexicana TaxID=516756 RepID=A0A310S7D0_9HYME|nr:Thyroid receptor-interacting protein 11 [Eufriesea mexicana]